MGKKSMLILLMINALLFLGACSDGGQAVSEDTIIIDKNGGVTGVIVEEFDKDYYSQDELSQMITDEINAYNGGGEQVKLDKFEIQEDGRAYVTISYATAQDYKDFNEAELFDGTISEAYNAGYEFTDVASVKEGEAGLDKKSVHEKGAMRVLIFSEPVAVQIPGKIAYVSDGVTVKAKRTAAADGDGLFYVIYE